MRIVLGIVRDNFNQILITQRPPHVAEGGYWEFPGGKIGAAESAEQALVRELKEELGLEVQSFEFLGEIEYHSPVQIKFLIYQVTHFSGQAACLEQQLGMKWVQKAHLNVTDFPRANGLIFDLIPE